MSFLDIFENVSASKASSLLSDSMRNTFRQCFINFNSYSKIDLYKLLEALYEKVGYAFLDFKGNFSNKLLTHLVWADKYSSNVLFEQDKIPEYNLFEMMTDYSQFIIRNKFGDSFYDFKKESSRIVNFSYSINILKEDKLMTASTDHFFSKLFNNLNNTKTLTSRASTILIQSKEDNKPYPCILLETKLASFRQNFDFFYWRCYLN